MLSLSYSMLPYSTLVILLSSWDKHLSLGKAPVQTCPHVPSFTSAFLILSAPVCLIKPFINKHQAGSSSEQAHYVRMCLQCPFLLHPQSLQRSLCLHKGRGWTILMLSSHSPHLSKYAELHLPSTQFLSVGNSLWFQVCIFLSLSVWCDNESHHSP